MILISIWLQFANQLHDSISHQTQWQKCGLFAVLFYSHREETQRQNVECQMSLSSISKNKTMQKRLHAKPFFSARHPKCCSAAAVLLLLWWECSCEVKSLLSVTYYSCLCRCFDGEKRRSGTFWSKTRIYYSDGQTGREREREQLRDKLAAKITHLIFSMSAAFFFHCCC